MKVSVALALVVACAAASYSAPVPRAVDWSAVAAKVGEIESLIRSSFEQIKSLANSDNSLIGAAISVILDDDFDRAKGVLARFDAAINDQSLTESQAVDLLGKLQDIIGELQTTLKDKLDQLTSAAAKIRQTLSETYAQVEQMGQELYALLS